MKSGFVAVAGRPNVGNATLVNALCGGKVAIVSDKPQTTRQRIFGIANGDDYQLVLADLPGFQRPRDPLTERMQRTVDQSFEEVDAVLFVLSARERIGAGDRFIAERVFSLGMPVVIALNKVDRLKPGHIAGQMTSAAPLGRYHYGGMIVALGGRVPGSVAVARPPAWRRLSRRDNRRDRRHRGGRRDREGGRLPLDRGRLAPQPRSRRARRRGRDRR